MVSLLINHFQACRQKCCTVHKCSGFLVFKRLFCLKTYQLSAVLSQSFSNPVFVQLNVNYDKNQTEFISRLIIGTMTSNLSKSRKFFFASSCFSFFFLREKAAKNLAACDDVDNI
jgi:hypothetical protein